MCHVREYCSNFFPFEDDPTHVCPACKRVYLDILEEEVLEELKAPLANAVLETDGLCLDCTCHKDNRVCRLPHALNMLQG